MGALILANSITGSKMDKLAPETVAMTSAAEVRRRAATCSCFGSSNKQAKPVSSRYGVDFMSKCVCSNVKVTIADDEPVDGKVRACFFFHGGCAHNVRHTHRKTLIKSMPMSD